MTPLHPSEWERWMRPGSRAFVGSGAACPHALMRSLIEHAATLKDIELVQAQTLGECPWLDLKLSDTFSVNAFVVGPEVRSAVEEGRADHTPCFLSELPGLFLEGILPLDVALVQVTPPDQHGFCSFGPSVHVVSAACQAARTVIAQINSRLPWTHGQSFIHRDRIAAFLIADEELPELVPPSPTAEMVTIGKYVAQLIEDGSTLRLGIGALPQAVLAALTGHRDLGIHSDVFSDAFLPLLESGVINNRRKSLHPGKSITSLCLGTRRVYDYIHDNPHVEFHPTEYVNSPAVIARNDRMVAVLSGREVDLSGQVVGDFLGGGFANGVGGQVDFIRGASMSRGGIPIIALPATAENGTVSRIVGALREGSGVVTSRGDVHYVVTEFGIATLRGRSIRERVLELLQVAHPKFRDELREQAVARGWLPKYQRSSPRPVADLGDVEVKKLRLRDHPYLLRPLHPSDIRRLQEFFYSHTLETIQMRYGFTVTRMTRERAYDLVNVDQSRDLALAIFETQGPRQIIHAIGRYYVDPSGKSAEVAFVVRETKRRQGMASVLLLSLIEVARKRGLEFLWGRVRRDNLPMLALFRRHGGIVIPTAEGAGSDLDVRLPLQPEAVESADHAASATLLNPPTAVGSRTGRRAGRSAGRKTAHD